MFKYTLFDGIERYATTNVLSTNTYTNTHGPVPELFKKAFEGDLSILEDKDNIKLVWAGRTILHVFGMIGKKEILKFRESETIKDRENKTPYDYLKDYIYDKIKHDGKSSGNWCLMGDDIYYLYTLTFNSFNSVGYTYAPYIPIYTTTNFTTATITYTNTTKKTR